MTYPPVYVVDIIGACVANVSAKLTPSLQLYDPNIINVNYQFGTPDEINQTLTQWTGIDGFDQQKYPCVWLLQSFPEDQGKEIGIDGEKTLNIIIARRNDPTLKSADRYVNNFKPVLYPVYYELLNQLDQSPKVASTNTGGFPHRKIDWPFWGGTDAQKKNPFNDKIDIIELRNLQIKIYSNAC